MSKLKLTSGFYSFVLTEDEIVEKIKAQNIKQVKLNFEIGKLNIEGMFDLEISE